MDLRSTLCCFASPNQVPIGLGAVQMGDWYGFRAGANCALADTCVPGFQGGFEKGMSAVVMLLAGADYGAQGILGANHGTSLEQLLDDEWASARDHIFTHGIELSEDTLGVDVIKRVGILEYFLADEHTVRHVRETYRHSSVFNDESWDARMARAGRMILPGRPRRWRESWPYSTRRSRR